MENQFFSAITSIIYNTYFNVIGGITISVAPFYFYILLTQSETLKNFKWFIINHSFWCLCLLLSFVIFKPILLLNAPCGFLLGIFRDTSMKSTIIALITMFGLAIMSIGGVCMTLIYRYFGLFPGKIKAVFYSLPMYIFLGTLYSMLWVLLGVIAKIIMNASQEDMIREAIELNPELEPFTHEKTFMSIPPYIFEIGSVVALTMLTLIGISFLVLIYLLKKELLSKLRTKQHKNLVRSVIAQVTVTLCFEFCPFYFLFSSVFIKIPYAGPAMQGMDMFLATHTLIEYCVTLYFVLPYRKYVSRKLNMVNKIWKAIFRKTNTVISKPRENPIPIGCTQIQLIHSGKHTM